MDVGQNAKSLILDLMQMKNFCEDPLIFEKGEGIYLTDIKGNRYIDGISGIYTVNVGHGNPYVLNAISEQMKKLSFAPPLHSVADTAVRYGQKLISVLPEGLGVIKLLSGGSEATETAVKFTRQYFRQSGRPERYKIISLYRGFHGATMGALSASGLAGMRKGVFAPFIEGYVKLQPPSCFHCPYGQEYPGCKCMCADMLEKTILGEGAESVAAFILEPISNTGGITTPPREYFSKIREICTRYGVLLIFDEVVTGMGRTGQWFAAQTYGVTPDILCAAKGIGGGYAPLSAVAIRSDLYYPYFWDDEEKGVQFASGHTFGGNPISAAAGIAVIEYIENNDLLRNGRETGEYLRRRLGEISAEMGVLGEVRGKGCMACIEFVEDMKTLRPFPAERRFGKRLEKRMKSNGLLLRCDPNWISFAPPLITSIGQADEMLDIFKRQLRAELDENR